MHQRRLSPEPEVSSAEVFPLSLSFDSDGAEFTMTSMLPPVVPVLGGAGLLTLGGLLSLAGAGTLRRFVRNTA